MKRPDLVVAAAVVVCLPMAPGIVHGSIDTTTALVRFLLALVVCSVGSWLLTSILTSYSNQARRAEILRQLAQTRSPAADAATGGAPAGGPPTPAAQPGSPAPS